MPQPAAGVHAGAHTLSAKYAAFAKQHAHLLRLVESVVQVRELAERAHIGRERVRVFA
jgi:hypothetical protein